MGKREITKCCQAVIVSSYFVSKYSYINKKWTGFALGKKKAQLSYLPLMAHTYVH